MCGNIVCVAAVLLGIDAGWQPLPQGGVVYLIQIEPQVFERLKSGEITAVESDVPPYVKDIRTHRISVGTAELPRELPPITEPHSIPRRLDHDPASKPIEEGKLTSYNAPTAPPPNPQPQPTTGGESREGEPAKPPWLWLTLTLLALFASLGGNLFLGWITWDARSRYRAILLGAETER